MTGAIHKLGLPALLALALLFTAAAGTPTANAAKWQVSPKGELVGHTGTWALTPTVLLTRSGPVISSVAPRKTSRKTEFLDDPTPTRVRAWKRGGKRWRAGRDMARFARSAEGWPQVPGGQVGKDFSYVSRSFFGGVWVRAQGRQRLLWPDEDIYNRSSGLMEARSRDGQASAIGALSVRKRGGRLFLRVATAGERYRGKRRGLRTYTLDLGHVRQQDEPSICSNGHMRNDCAVMLIDRQGRVGVVWSTHRGGIHSIWRGPGGKWGSIEVIVESKSVEPGEFPGGIERLAVAFDHGDSNRAKRAVIAFARPFVRQPPSWESFNRFVVMSRGAAGGTWSKETEREFAGNPFNGSLFGLDAAGGRYTAIWAQSFEVKEKHKPRFHVLSGKIGGTGRYTSPSLPKGLRGSSSRIDHYSQSRLIQLPGRKGALLIAHFYEGPGPIVARRLVDGRAAGGWKKVNRGSTHDFEWDETLGVDADDRQGTVGVAWRDAERNQIRYRAFR